jgi:lycopene cyclase domain-containing protein
MTYTQLALAGVALAVVVDVVVVRTRLIVRRAFWVSYAIIVSFQLITNGILTSLEIVRYDGAVIIGGPAVAFLGAGRIAWAPIEDLLFGFSLVLQTLAWWVFWGRRGLQREPRSGPPRGRATDARGS